MGDREHIDYQRHEEGTGNVTPFRSIDARLFPATTLELEQFVRERVHRALCELDSRVENAVRRAIFGDPPDMDDLPVRSNAPDPGGERQFTLEYFIRTMERIHGPYVAHGKLRTDSTVSTSDASGQERNTYASLNALITYLLSKHVDSFSLDFPGYRDDDERVEAHIVTVKDASYVQKLEHLLLSCADFLERPSIAGDVRHAYAQSLAKTIRRIFEDDCR